MDTTNTTANDAYMRQWTGSLLVKELLHAVFVAKPFPKSTLIFCQMVR